MDYVQMHDITKRYGHITANEHIDLSLAAGEIHSLLGENGAGKTTLMKMLYGMTRPSSGHITVNGKQVTMRSPKDAIAMGISMVHQHFMLVEPLTVAENIVLAYEPHMGIFFDFEKAVSQVRDLSKHFMLDIDPHARIQDIPVGQKQRVEIIKALYRQSDLIILDEPTAVLTALEVQELFKILLELKKAGKTIVIITHKLKEVMQISDRVTVLRGGRKICTCMTDSTDPDELAELMVGREVTAMKHFLGQDVPKAAPVYLELQDAVVTESKVPKLRGVSLQVRSGEILGICGVEGNGQTELIQLVTGLTRLKSGKMFIRQEEITETSPDKMLKLGVAHIPEDRSTRGLIADFSICSNIILGYHKKKDYCSRGILNWNNIKKTSKKIVESYRIKAESIDEPVGALSGGNQQKVVIGRALSQNPDIIVAAQPTRGVDIGAIEYIHEKLVEIKKKGKAILLISAEIDELMALSDNLAVLYKGKIVAYGKTNEFDDHRLGMLMTGLNEEETEPCEIN